VRSQSAIVFVLLGALACTERKPTATEAANPIDVELAAHDSERDIEASGWRMRGDVFESVHEGLRMRVPSGWRLGSPSEFDMTNPFVGLGLIHEQHDIRLYVRSVTFVGVDTEQIRHGHAQAFLSRAEEAAPPMVVDLYGERMQLTAGTDDNWEYLHGLTFSVGRPLEIGAFYPSTADRELMREHLGEAIAAIELLAPDAVDTLRDELERSPSRRDLLAKDQSLRGATFHDFAFGVRVTVPSNVMEASLDAGGEEVQPRLRLEDRSRDFSALLLAQEFLPDAPMTAEQWHELLVQQICVNSDVSPRGTAKVQTFGDAEGLVITLANPDIGLRLRVATVVHGQRGLAFVVRKGTRIRELGGDGVEEALAAFEVVEGLERARLEGDRYVDAHAGFAITGLPNSEPETDFAAEPGYSQSLTMWRSGDELVVVAAYTFALSQQSMQSLLDMRLEELQEIDPLIATRTWVELSTPARGRRTTWEAAGFEQIVALFQRERTIYEVHVKSSAAGQFQRVLEGFELVD
jgi:hypothetical protein